MSSYAHVERIAALEAENRRLRDAADAAAHAERAGLAAVDLAERPYEPGDGT